MQNVLLGLALSAAWAWNPVHASKINDLELSSGPTGTRAEIVLDQVGEFSVISLQAPHRLAVDLPASSLAPDLRLPTGVGIVKSIRTGQPAPGTARIVFDLAEPVAALKPRIEHGAAGPRLVLEWPDDGTTPVAASGARSDAPAAGTSTNEAAPVDQAAASAAATTRLISQIAARVAGPGPASAPATVATASAPPSQPEPPVRTLQQIMQGAGMRPLVIAIDPGHGGQDPGAVGPNGSREKDVVLAISRELARQINATAGLKAYLTRDGDKFIPLNERAKLARAAKADMFISIHADAAENRNADGSSVYVLSLKGASSQRARWLADKENASDLVGGVRLAQAGHTLASVLLDLTQSGHMKASEDAAGEVLGGLKRVGNNHKPHIERANFAVLRTSDMPAMLVETAFISNPQEERRLRDPAFQRKVAGAVLDGINTFFTRQPPPGTMYAARAAAATGASGAVGGSR